MAGFDGDAEELQIDEELIGVMVEVLLIDEQHGEEGFAGWSEIGGDGAVEVGVGGGGEAFGDEVAESGGVARRGEEVSEAIGVEAVEAGGESGERFGEMGGEFGEGEGGEPRGTEIRLMDGGESEEVRQEIRVGGDLPGEDRGDRAGRHRNPR